MKPATEPSVPAKKEEAVQAEDEEAAETTPLLTKAQIGQTREDVRTQATRFAKSNLSCYLSGPHCTISEEARGGRTIVGYEVQKLTTMRVFFVMTGTVIQNPVLWVETLCIALITMTVFLSMAAGRWKGFNKFVGEESDLRAFIAMFSTLIGLLLSFYTSLNIKRWWDMRMSGVADIWQASSKLTFLLSQGVTRDHQVLEAVQRYACASLMLIFMRRRGQNDACKVLVDQEILTEDEAAQLRKLGMQSDGTYNDQIRAEAIWMWVGQLVTQCMEQGLVKGPPNYSALMGAVEQGRHGAAVINAYLDTPVPMAYVHLLGLMVKLHNVILALLMGVLSVKHWGGGPDGNTDEMSLFRTLFRAFFMPFLYNSILLINDDLTDPFNGDISDFPMTRLCDGLRTDATNFIRAGENLPQWLTDKRKFEGVV